MDNSDRGKKEQRGLVGRQLIKAAQLCCDRNGGRSEKAAVPALG